MVFPLPALVLGVLALLSFAAALLLAHRGRHRPAVALLLTGGLALRLAAGTDLYLHRWDERYHALVAKNLMRHPLTPTLYDDPVLPYDYRDWSANHVWVHKQPLPLWAMALSMKLFGVNEIALRLPSLALSTAGIALTAAIAASLFSPPVGFLAALLHAISLPVILTAAGRMTTDHIDAFHLFFVELGVFIAMLAAGRRTRRRLALLGFVLGLAILCKWLTALIVLPLWLILVRGRWPLQTIALDLLVVAGVCCATFLPWQIHVHAAFPQEARWESLYNLRHFTEALDGHGGPWTFHVRALARYGTLIALPLAWFLFQAARRRREPRWTLPAVWFCVPFAFFTFAKTKMDAYTLFAGPALFVMAAAFAHGVLGARAPGRWRTVLAAAFLLAVAGPLPNVKDFLLTFSRPGGTNERTVIVKSVGRQVPDTRAVFFNAPPIETMFYTAGTAYEELPTNEQVDALTARGYRVYIVETGIIPEGYRERSRATFVKP